LRAHLQLQDRCDHREIVSDAMVELVHQQVLRPLGRHGVFQRFAQGFADRRNGEADQDEQQHGKQVLRGKDKRPGRRENEDRQDGAQQGGVEAGSPIEQDRSQENAGQQEKEAEEARLHLDADLQQEADENDERRDRISYRERFEA
jgi:hypothetical protein